MGRPSGRPVRDNDPRGQIGEMRRVFPGFRARVGRDRKVTWTGTLQPNPSSPAYTVRVVYGRRGPPQVRVLDPRLSKNAPHRYPDGSLCLYWPREWRWASAESLARTIVGWTALWLQYYEIWLALGVWMGPSSHDEPEKGPR